MSGRKLLTDPEAQSADSSLPAFLSRPDGAPNYHGFVVVAQTYTEGWALGAITEFEDPAGCNGGDAFVVAPDGSRAGLIWEVGVGSIQEVLPPTPDRWGVCAVWFSNAVRTADDLVFEFRRLLPQLREIHARVTKHVG